MENITIEGNGSLIMFHGKMTTFACIDCKNVTFKNLELDFQVPTVIDVTVEELIGSDSAIISIPSCYNYSISGNNVVFFSDNSPYTDTPFWSINAKDFPYTQRYDKNTERTFRGDIRDNAVFSNISGIRDLGNNRLQIIYSRRSDELVTNMCFQMRPTIRDHAGAFIWKSNDISLENLDIRFLHGFGLVGQHSENITLDGVNFQTNSDRGVSSACYADFVQMSDCKGNIDIKNCTFINPHDDAINIHGTYLQVASIFKNKISVRYMHDETAGFPNFFVGDEIEFIDNRTLSALENSRRTVIAVNGPDGMGGQTGSGFTDSRTIILTLNEAPPANIAPLSSYYVENLTCSPDVHIHNNTFGNIPSRGILVTARGAVIIENNVFESVDKAGIFISNDASNWYESGRVENAIIKNNTFMRCNAQAILIEPTNKTVLRSSPVHSNLKIEDNTFFVKDDYIVEAKSVNGLDIINNKIYFQLTYDNPEQGLDEDTLFPAEHENSEIADGNAFKLYRLRGCTSVNISNNVYPKDSTVIIEYSDMYDSDITTNDNATIIELASENAAESIKPTVWIATSAAIGIVLIVIILTTVISRKRKHRHN